MSAITRRAPAPIFIQMDIAFEGIGCQAYAQACPASRPHAIEPPGNGRPANARDRLDARNLALLTKPARPLKIWCKTLSAGVRLCAPSHRTAPASRRYNTTPTSQDNDLDNRPLWDHPKHDLNRGNNLENPFLSRYISTGRLVASMRGDATGKFDISCG